MRGRVLGVVCNSTGSSALLHQTQTPIRRENGACCASAQLTALMAAERLRAQWFDTPVSTHGKDCSVAISLGAVLQLCVHIHKGLECPRSGEHNISLCQQKLKSPLCKRATELFSAAHDDYWRTPVRVRQKMACGCATD